MDRATVFGGIAETYDQFRPMYPKEMWEALFTFTGRVDRVLEIGCGTGLATLDLSQRGRDTTAIDVDDRMLVIARRKQLEHVTFTQSSFEDFVGGPFDLIFAGSSWHWVDVDIGPTKAATLLRSGGVLAIAWNLPLHRDTSFADELKPIYEELAPAETGSSHLRNKDEGRHWDRLVESGLYQEPKMFTLDWSKMVGPEEYTAILSTHSDHILLGEDALAGLLTTIEEVVARHGTEVELPYRTVMYMARIRPPPKPAGV